jgi:hypothetical protein
MTPTERAALLLKVQRALDAAGIGRKEIGEQYKGFRNWWVGFGEFDIRFNKDDINIKGMGYPTFTFAELFPELEWVKNSNNNNLLAYTPDESYAFEIREEGGIWLDISQGWSEISFNFRTPERAKRAAQSIADLLAEAGGGVKA